MPQGPRETDEHYWGYLHERRNRIAREFNKDWVNRLFKLKMPLMPSWDEAEELARKEYQKNETTS